MHSHNIHNTQKPLAAYTVVARYLICRMHTLHTQTQTLSENKKPKNKRTRRTMIHFVRLPFRPANSSRVNSSQQRRQTKITRQLEENFELNDDKFVCTFLLLLLLVASASRSQNEASVPFYFDFDFSILLLAFSANGYQCFLHKSLAQLGIPLYI